MHCFITFDTMRKCSVNILAGLTPLQYREFRVTMMSLILATDLQQHFEVCASPVPVLLLGLSVLCDC